jgi:hypothetical protein
MSSLSMMVHRCTIQRDTPENVDGVIVPDWDDVATSQPCLIQEGSGRLRQSASGEYLLYSAIGFFPPSADLRPQALNDRSDRIVIESPSRLAGAMFTVLLVVDESGMGNHLTAYLDRLPAGAPEPGT